MSVLVTMQTNHDKFWTMKEKKSTLIPNHYTLYRSYNGPKKSNHFL